MFRVIRLFFIACVVGLQSINLYAHSSDDFLSIQRLPLTKKQSAKELTNQIRLVLKRYVEVNSLVSKDYPYTTGRDSDRYRIPFEERFSDYDLTNSKFQNAETLYELVVGGRSYIAGLASYVPVLRAVPDCVPSDTGTVEAQCQRMAENERVCHLFLFDFQTHEIAAVGVMPIERDNRPLPGGKKRSWINYDPKFPNDPRQIEGWPRCREVLAVAPAKVIPNALLITLSYLDSAASISKYGYEDDESKFTTTVLMRFSASSNGKVQITADQRCLGNPNTINSIAAARKTLAKCEADSTQSHHPK